MDGKMAVKVVNAGNISIMEKKDGDIVKAAFLYGKEKLTLREVPVPEIGSDRGVVRVKSAAICGTDVRMYKNSGYLAYRRKSPDYRS